jgi:hypothetical protein
MASYCDLQFLKEEQLKLKNNCEDLLREVEQDECAYLGYSEVSCEDILYGYRCFILAYNENRDILITPKYNLNINWPKI